MREQLYRANFWLRRRGEPALDHNHIELKTEDYSSDEEFCLALAAEALEMLREDREYIEGVEDGSN